ncbi:auxin-responsive protein SAUR71-like [Pyrus communis]|uniref:auxin-responsive protein SAUR71-like n=1 Tax=Pyrus communis TaxID=23211 RepID=UPI0035BEB70D
MKRVLRYLLIGVRSSKLLSQLIGAPGVKRLKSPSMPPKGYVPVCVDVDGYTKRFIVHTTLLRHTEFLELLYKSAEEYDFCNDGVLRIPCEAKDFEEYWMTKTSKPKIYKVEPVQLVCC